MSAITQQGELRDALEALVKMCVTHIGGDYTPHVHACYERGKAALDATPRYDHNDIEQLLALREFLIQTFKGATFGEYKVDDAIAILGRLIGDES